MSWSQNQIDQVWAKASHQGENNEKNGFRKDQCGAWIREQDHGNTKSAYGWQVDHIKVRSKGGTDEISNLRPLHHENNAAKGDGNLQCVVTSNGNKNVKN